MEKTHSESFVVRPTDCDLYGRMRPDALFIAMQEGGEHHAVKLGFGYEPLLARGLFFALSRIHLSTVRAPRYGERVVHTTWPGVPNRFFFPRFHTFALEDGTPLACAGGLWVLLDSQNRRVVSPAKAGLSFPDNSDLPAPVELPHRLPVMRDAQTVFERAPQYSDYDVNGHVNNTRYIAWLCDALGVEAMRGSYLGELTVGYEKEIREADPLALSLAREGDAFTFRIASADGVNRFVAGGSLRREADA